MNIKTNASNHLLAQADLLLLLADMLRPPTEARSRLADLRHDDLRGLVECTDLPERGALLQAVAAACEACQSASLEDWSDEYHRLFEGATVCPLNETAYIRRDKGAILGDLAGYYRAFGWSPGAHAGEKPDHLVAELEFMGILFAMRAQASPEEVSITADALASFAADHLNDWIGTVCQQLQTCTRLTLYQSIEGALRLAWQAMLAAHGWPVTPSVAIPFTPGGDAEPLCECGVATTVLSEPILGCSQESQSGPRRGR